MYKSLKTKIKSRQFAVIRHRYSLLEILTWRVHNVIAKAMSICVAVGNKYYVESSVANRFRSQCAPDATGFLSDVYKRGTRARKFLTDGVQYGRSMIEMLGVLAIIGVLSVGGIAGYSKAMEKFKINKMIDEYTYLINGLLEYKDNLIKSNPAEGSIKLYDFILAANLVPPSWTTENTWAMTDTIGNTVVPYLNNQSQYLVLDVHLRTTGKGTADFAYNSCVTLFKDIAKPLSQNFVGIFAGSSATSVHYDGSLYCHNGKDNTKCLSDMTLPEIDEACKKCLAGKSSCMVTMVW